MTSRNLLSRILAGTAFALAFSAAQAAVIVSTDATNNMSCAGGVCTPTAKDAVINATDLANMLASSDVTLKTDSKAKNILINAAFSWTSPHRLTLDAYQNIKVQQVVTVAGQGGLTLMTNDGGTGGDYSFASPGYITFWDTSSSLVVNGQSYTLLNDIHTLANGIAANPSSNYALAKNYDATADGTYAHAPVSTAYGGSFEGLGNTIDYLTILSTSCGVRVGLFATLNVGGAIRDINLPNASVRDGASSRCSESVGALVGYSGGTITGASAAGAVSSASGKVEIGGLAGYVNGTVIASHFTGTVSGHGKDKGAVGGLVGYLSGTVLQSSAHADVKNGRTVGGLVGDGYVDIDLSSAGGTVKGQFAGGLIGASSGTITRSFATANVVAQNGGGLAGVTGNNSTIVADYSTGSVTALGSAFGYRGGFLGINNSGTFGEVYATGRVSTDKTSCAAGFVGYGGGIYSWAYWDETTTQQVSASCSDVQGITGLTDSELKSKLPYGFDPQAWGHDPNINNDWPYLLANPPQ